MHYKRSAINLLFVADLFGDIPEEEKAKLGGLPGSLGDALKALEADHEYLTRGGVFPERLLQVFIRCCRKADEAVARAPHPAEFSMYYDL